MTDSALERAARAICCSGEGCFAEKDGRPGLCCWRTHDHRTRAAIAAIREPTKAMIAAGESCLVSDLQEAWQIDFDEIWRAMIDAILDEKC